VNLLLSGIAILAGAVFICSWAYGMYVTWKLLSLRQPGTKVRAALYGPTTPEAEPYQRAYMLVVFIAVVSFFLGIVCWAIAHPEFRAEQFK
jgi:hypothetical protein